jgi:ectoine hydroxylase-related dioxygenase (phytanoyl-CoA dioxygenase family)
MSAAWLESLGRRIDQLLEKEGDAAGSEFKHEPGARRLANLVDKDRIFEEVMLHPTVLEAVAHVLGPRFKLSSFNARTPNPYGQGSQPLHVDSGALPDEQGYWVANSIWMLDDFTAENGATRIIPGSQSWRRLPPAGSCDPYPGERLITGQAGTVAIMNAHLWHAGTANRTAHPRRALHVYFTRWDKPQQQYQKRLLSPEVEARLNPEARRLLALDDPLNDELSLTGSGASGFLK